MESSFQSCNCKENLLINKIGCSGAATIYNTTNIVSDHCQTKLCTKCNNFICCLYCSNKFCGDINNGCAKEVYPAINIKYIKNKVCCYECRVIHDP